MKSLKQIEAMITLLEEVRDEITLYNKFKENGNLNKPSWEYEGKYPSGTYMRENLKTVSRMARKTADNIVLTNYYDKLEKSEE